MQFSINKYSDPFSSALLPYMPKHLQQGKYKYYYNQFNYYQYYYRVIFTLPEMSKRHFLKCHNHICRSINPQITDRKESVSLALEVFYCKLKQMLSPCIAGGVIKDCHTRKKSAITLNGTLLCITFHIVLPHPDTTSVTGDTLRYERNVPTRC